ncbi:MAG: Gfo/Idh/MocA family protein [Planctomycetota bacterium]
MAREKGPLRLAVIGCGRIAQAHLSAIASSSRTECALVVETRETAGKAAAEQYGCRYRSDYRELGDGLDAVIVCTPPHTHFEIARFSLEAGLHVLCEKPLALTTDQAETLVSISERGGRWLGMCSKFRYVDDVIKAKALLESGILGRAVLYENTFARKIPMQDRWNSDRSISGGGVLIDNGSHSVDIARYLLGPIEAVQAERAIGVQGLEVEETVRLLFRSESGVLGVADLSWTINKEQDSYIRIFGAEGTLEVGWNGSRYRQASSKAWVAFGDGYDKLGAIRRQLENFAGTVMDDDPPLITPEDALASVRVIEAAYRSLKNDDWVTPRATPRT